MEFQKRFIELLGDKRGVDLRLSEAIGASTGTVSDWKSGKKKPSLEYIIKIAEYFAVTTDDLLGLAIASDVAARAGNVQEAALLGAFRALPAAVREVALKQVIALGEAFPDVEPEAVKKEKARA